MALLKQRSAGDRFAYTAWFLHCRNLMDFYEGKGHEADEICAQHLLPQREREWHLARRAEPYPPDYAKWRRHANKLASHLTYSRIKYGAASPPPSVEITCLIIRLGIRFLSLLPPPSVNWFVTASIDMGEAV